MYRERLHKQSKLEVTRFREHPLTAEIHMNVTNEALTMMWPQLEAAEKAICTETRLPECTNAFTRQWGLPCRHRLYGCLVSQSPLGYEHFSRHWWLWEPKKSELSHEEQETRLILDPLVVPKTRHAQAAQEAQGPASRWPRPTDVGQKRKRDDSGHDNSTRRDPSHWESGRRQKRPAAKKKAPKPTIRELAERLDAIQASQNSQTASQVSSQGNPMTPIPMPMAPMATIPTPIMPTSFMPPTVPMSMPAAPTTVLMPTAPMPMLTASMPMSAALMRIPTAPIPMRPPVSQTFAPSAVSCISPPSAQVKAYEPFTQTVTAPSAPLIPTQNQAPQGQWDSTQQSHKT